MLIECVEEVNGPDVNVRSDVFLELWSALFGDVQYGHRHVCQGVNCAISILGLNRQDGGVTPSEHSDQFVAGDDHDDDEDD